MLDDGALNGFDPEHDRMSVSQMTDISPEDLATLALAFAVLAALIWCSQGGPL